ncbi:MAG: CPBP family glutamic-type intramembrane protease [Actinomycetaceae bacterium]|nr:CPBP family glutamic-type intramembrane protease [Actinomycetaceae bacterium]
MAGVVQRFTRLHGTLHAGTLIVGATLLGISTHLAAGSPVFYFLTATLGVIWFGGAWVTHEERGLWGWLRECDAVDRKPPGSAISIGLGIGGALAIAFIAGAFLIDLIPPLRDPLVDLLEFARFGALPTVTIITVTTGCAEEIYFRGALFRDLPEKWAMWASAGLYALVTSVSGIALLTLSALTLGIVCGYARAHWGRVDQCIVIHLVWSLTMLYVLPLIIT